MTGFMASRYEFQDITRIGLIKWRLYVYKWITWNDLHWYHANFCDIVLEMIGSICRRYKIEGKNGMGISNNVYRFENELSYMIFIDIVSTLCVIAPQND